MYQTRDVGSEYVVNEMLDLISPYLVIFSASRTSSGDYTWELLLNVYGSPQLFSFRKFGEDLEQGESIS